MPQHVPTNTSVKINTYTYMQLHAHSCTTLVGAQVNVIIYYMYGISGPSLLIESTDSMINFNDLTCLFMIT